MRSLSCCILGAAPLALTLTAIPSRRDTDMAMATAMGITGRHLGWYRGHH